MDHQMKIHQTTFYSIHKCVDFHVQYGEKKANEEFWDLVDKQIGVRFWAGMPWMPEGEELYKYLKKYKPSILTSPSREESSRIGKSLWVKRNMSGIPVKFGYGANGKAKFSGPNKILIDDRDVKIEGLYFLRYL